jgi:hypothetical protein
MSTTDASLFCNTFSIGGQKVKIHDPLVNFSIRLTNELAFDVRSYERNPVW